MLLRPVWFALALVLVLVSPGLGWNNGPSGNANTDTAAECSNPPYATHDWIAEQALMLLPQAERDWLMPFKAVYLIGTEAPDFKHIPTACQMPHSGYDDRSQGHSVEWPKSGSNMVKDRAAQRAQEGYNKAAIAFRQGNPRAAAFYLGAMAHYIGDVSQYGHSIPTRRTTATTSGSSPPARTHSTRGTSRASSPSTRSCAARPTRPSSASRWRRLVARVTFSRRRTWTACGPRSRHPTLKQHRPLAQPGRQRVDRRAAYVLPERRVRGGRVSFGPAGLVLRALLLRRLANRLAQCLQIRARCQYPQIRARW
jgi:hypothetical protein